MPKTTATTPPTSPTTTTRRNEPYIEIAQDEDGWHWQLWSGNGRPIARNAVPYETKKHLLQALEVLAPNVNTANAIVQMSKDE